MNEQLKIIISAEVDKLKKATQEAKGAIEDLKTKSGLSAEDIDNNFKAAGDSINNAMKTAGAAIAAAGTALLALGASTTEYRQNQAQLNAAFEQAGFSAGSAKVAYKELYKVIGEDDQAVESAANIAMLANSEKEAAQWAELASGVLGTFHDTLQPEAFFEAANETLKLNEATGAFTQMLEQTGVMSVEDFNKKLAECSTEAEKQAFMLSVSKSAMGEAGASYNEATASIQKQREEQVALNASLATLGEAVAPIVTAFISFGSDALAVVVPYIQQLAQDYLPELKAILEGVTDALKVAFEWASKHKEVLAAVAIVIGTVAAAIALYNAVAAIKAAMAALEVTSVWALVAAYAAQAAAMLVAIAPYVLIVAAIAAVVAAIIYCVKHWDKIKAKVKEVWDNIKKKTEETVKNVVNKYEELKTKALAKVTALKDSAVEKFNNIKSRAVSIFNAVKDAITKPVDKARDKVKTAVDKIKALFDFDWSLPKPKIPKFNISGGEAPWGFAGKGSLPSISVSWNALGGVFDKPTLFSYGGSLQGLGENGAEAVVPLEKNTQWLDRLASMLAEKQGGNRPIILQVDGKTFAQTSIDSINALTKQKGKLGLNIM